MGPFNGRSCFRSNRYLSIQHYQSRGFPFVILEHINWYNIILNLMHSYFIYLNLQLHTDYEHQQGCIFKIQDDRTNSHNENLSVTKFEETKV